MGKVLAGQGTMKGENQVAFRAASFLLLLGPALADMGYYTKGLQGSSVSLAEAVLVIGCVLALFSILTLLIALHELRGKFLLARCYSFAHIVLAILWLPVVGMSICLLIQRHYPAVAFLASGAVFAAAHIALAVRQLLWCCCAGTFPASSAENPKSALLKSPNGGDTGQQGRADSPAGGSDAARGSCDHFNPVAGVSGAGGLESRNPFHTTYGMLPGTSVLAYQIFIPGCEEPPAPAQQPQHGGSCGPLSPGRADSPISSDGRRQLRGSAQTLVQMQPTSARSRH